MRYGLVLGLVLIYPCLMWAQVCTLHGQVSDPLGAIVPGTTVTLSGAGGMTKTARTGSDGAYTFAALAAGSYQLTAEAPDLKLIPPVPVTLTAGGRTMNLQMQVVAAQQSITVEDRAGAVLSTEAGNNAGAVTLRGSDLDALADDPTDLESDLQALAGPSAGPNGGSIFVDGFSGGQLPPKDAIREIRINQNPFSPEFDQLGLGRIEVFTKPGSEKLAGSVGYNFATDKWNTRNPYATRKAPFALEEIRSNFSGPINKRASYYLNLQHEWKDNGNIMNAVVLDSANHPQRFTGAVTASQDLTVVSPRVDWQLNGSNTLVARYTYNHDDVRNAGVGGFNLESRGVHSDLLNQMVQITETAVLGANAVNETRFQYYRPKSVSTANSADPAMQVLGAFNGGGAPVGRSHDVQNSCELQNWSSVVRGAHAWKLGVRLRRAEDVNWSPQNFAGTYTYGGGIAPELDVNDQIVLDASSQPVLVTIDSIERYRRTQAQLPGGGATQFSINTGNPYLAVRQLDGSAFVGDDWTVHPNVTASLGLRYEAQSNISDWRDVAPRIGLAWSPGAHAKAKAINVFRAGFGIFYDRFPLSNTLTTERYNGVAQRQYVVTDPAALVAILANGVPSAADLAASGTPGTIQRVSGNLRAPYAMQSALTWERQLPRNTVLSVTYANGHGLHLLRSRTLPAPAGTVFEMMSAGLYNQNQLILNVNSNPNKNLSLTGSYVYNRARSNTDGIGTFPANPDSMAGEYGPAATDVHHRVTLSGTVVAKWGIRFNPLLIVNSGPPFDITTGSDVYGDTLFNARPGLAFDLSQPGVVATKYGLLNPNPAPGEALLSRNDGRGPGQVVLNMRITRIFYFGTPREGAPKAARPYNTSVSMSIRNLANHNNPGPIIGDITSSLFGRANQPAFNGNGRFAENANNRRLELQVRFNF